jgi:hypothetical protein
MTKRDETALRVVKGDVKPTDDENVLHQVVRNCRSWALKKISKSKQGQKKLEDHSCLKACCKNLTQGLQTDRRRN